MKSADMIHRYRGSRYLG